MEIGNSSAYRRSSFLGLPLEMRHCIYLYHLRTVLSLSSEALYFSQDSRELRPKLTPLIHVNTQIRDEVLEMLKADGLIELYITPRGTRFSGVTLTTLVANNLKIEFSMITTLRVVIWPPHPDRPADIVGIWRELRQLRSKLVQRPPLLKILFYFQNNKIASWTSNGKVPRLLKSFEDNDIVSIMELLSAIRADRPIFRISSPSTIDADDREELEYGLSDVCRVMIGETPYREIYDENDGASIRYMNGFEEECELRLEKVQADICRGKLDMMTEYGKNKLTWREWKEFKAKWTPNFDKVGYKGLWTKYAFPEPTGWIPWDLYSAEMPLEYE
ncbi:uncharacterized protein KY384_006303 [Bacidia gigantensis]|uniref:uncharacterized protein n=1 Tax=Bacidia gigantensis TaxID=2732470 RepID=UPI001D03E094|nr:uncharacterized protein KY384_006303 [Bacidia gigantensis]KAG8528616.1 hypothetical protein KY384_006303 [Bacidia gigantensis]